MKVRSNFIKKIKLLGCKLAIDDFGSGYSNFERLLDYQPDIIKIDGSLIKNIKRKQLPFAVKRINLKQNNKKIQFTQITNAFKSFVSLCRF